MGFKKQIKKKYLTEKQQQDSMKRFFYRLTIRSKIQNKRNNLD